MMNRQMNSRTGYDSHHQNCITEKDCLMVVSFESCDIIYYNTMNTKTTTHCTKFGSNSQNTERDPKIRIRLSADTRYFKEKVSELS